jgi:hypothetical protein
MVCSALGVLTCIAKMEQHAHMFANESTMSNMCRDIALPNIAIRGNASLLWIEIYLFIYLFIYLIFIFILIII